MATATVATAAGAVALLYYALRRRGLGEDEQEVGSSVRSEISRAPSTWFEALAILSEALRFTYAETFGKWPLVDLAFGINFLMKRQGHLQASNIFAGEGSSELRSEEELLRLKELLHLVIVCIHFSKKPFPAFVDVTGYSQDSVLLKESKAGLLKPAFAILVDEKLHCILLLIRGTHSVKDTLTALTGAVVPFHHTVLDGGGVNNLVIGHAHCGMVAAARWIAEIATPVLLQARTDYPDFKIKIVGHSLGGGTAALLTYILRERRDFSFIECVCFGPAACMTWELAESGRSFTTSVISGFDLVPTFSAASVDDLRNEVTASAWIKDFQEQIEKVQFLKTVMRSTSALSSGIASASKPLYPLGGAAKAGVASALRPVSGGTQVVLKQAQNVVQAVKSRSSRGWSCLSARRITTPSLTVQGTAEIVEEVESRNLTECGDCNLLSGESTETKEVGVNLPEDVSLKMFVETEERADESSPAMSSEGSTSKVIHEQHDELHASATNYNIPKHAVEYQIWQELEQELDHERELCIQERQEEEAAAKEITQEEEENIAAKAAEIGSDHIVTEPEHGKGQGRELNRFFPPGCIIHLVPLSQVCSDGRESAESAANVEESSSLLVGLFATDRSLYGKIRLSRTMLKDHYMPSYKIMLETLIEDLERKISFKHTEVK